MSLSDLDKKYLISTKVLYLVLSIQFFTLHQFRSIFATEKFHIDKTQLGFYMGFLLFLTFFTNVGIAAMNDKFNRPKSLLVALIVSSCAFFQLFYIKSYSKSESYIFWIVMFFYLMLNSSIMPIFDKITLEYISKIPGIGAKTYGRQRMWGTIGYLIANFSVEMLAKKKVDGKTVYEFGKLQSFQLFSTFVATVCTLTLIKSPNVRTTTQNVFNGFLRLLSNFNYLFFILVIFLNGVCRASMTTYLSIYQTKVLELEGYKVNFPLILKPIEIFNNLPIFTCSFFGVLVEIILFFCSSSITTTFGLYWPLLIAQFAALLRFFCYYLLPPTHPHVYLFSCAFELLKGVNFGFTHISGVQLATLLCPPEVKATSQMIYYGVFVGIASMFSGVLFGPLFSTGKMEDENLAVSEKVGIFRKFYIFNILLTLLAIGMFVMKYGVSDRVLAFLPWKGAEKERKLAEKNKAEQEVIGGAEPEGKEEEV
ncbi:nucleoside transporter [Tubulinosema ratisbonensis]|uniref:Nucleoside transporter n=1 Tax=Tubulinosema ratisbonensis TaxID=291195 RepID=A0A437AM82_9MICR|nr:nucleoside transporter [Tubulinosema ratisbonensis]